MPQASTQLAAEGVPANVVHSVVQALHPAGCLGLTNDVAVLCLSRHIRWSGWQSPFFTVRMISHILITHLYPSQILSTRFVHIQTDFSASPSSAAVAA